MNIGIRGLGMRRREGLEGWLRILGRKIDQKRRRVYWEEEGRKNRKNRRREKEEKSI
jgi:hypothetical protein